MGLADDRKPVNLMTVHVSKSVTVHEVSNNIYSANVDVYYPDIKFVYDTTKIEMSQYYFDCYYIRNNSKYNITFCRDAVSCLDQAYEWFSKRLLEI